MRHLRGDPTKPLSLARRLVRGGYLVGVRSVLEAADPSPALMHAWARDDAAPEIALLSIYRRSNAHLLVGLLDQLPAGSIVRLWALDEPAEALSGQTIGAGRGNRFVLLNRLLHGVEDPSRWVLLADDDVRFERGTPRDYVAAASRARFDLSQPAHHWRSKVNHPFTRAWPLSIARTTGFVEQGPVVLLSPAARAGLTPFPEDIGMGWGIEALWSSQAEGSGLRLGIVDAVRMRHMHRGGQAYDVTPLRAQESQLLAQAGVSDWSQMQRAQSRWWAWRRRAPRD